MVVRLLELVEFKKDSTLDLSNRPNEHVLELVEFKKDSTLFLSELKWEEALELVEFKKDSTLGQVRERHGHRWSL